jgi:hypothetical protein
VTNFKSQHLHEEAKFWVGDYMREMKMDFVTFHAVCQLLNEAYKAGGLDERQRLAAVVKGWVGEQ